MREISIEEYEKRYRDRAEPGLAGLRLYETEKTELCLPRRDPVSHKYSYGRALILAGSRGYSGAPVLAANACERAGSGLTRLLVPESIYTIAAARCDGAVVTPLPAAEEGGFSASGLPELLAALKKADACALGPGLGPGEEARELVRAALQAAACPLVLDADGLTACAKEPELLKECPSPLILTPHEGEFRRLGGDLTRGRLVGALRFTAQHPNVILILKGCGTLIVSGGEAVVNPTGGPAMAKGGTGDVLCGILTALLAQGFDPGFSARCAVYLHGLAGDLAAKELGEYSLAPSDLIAFLPRAFKSLTGEAEA